MATTGKIMDFYSDKEMTTAAFPRTKVKAVSDDNGTGLDALLSEIESSIPTSAIDLGALPLAGGTMEDGAIITIPGSGTPMSVGGGIVRITGSSSAGWSRGLFFQNSDASSTLRFGGFGNAGTLTYIYLGSAYDNYALAINPSNNLLLGDENYGTALPATPTAGRIFFKKV